MSKLISSINITIDGFCGHEDVVADEEHHEFINDLLAAADKVLLGRVTFQLFESYWPLAAKDTSLPKAMFDFANLIDNIQKVVVSKTLENTEWRHTTIIQDLSEKSISKLKQDSSKSIVILGSPSIISKLSELKLIDDYYFSVQPIIAGQGKHLFETFSLNKSNSLKLVVTNQYKSGVVTLRYGNS